MWGQKLHGANDDGKGMRSCKVYGTMSMLMIISDGGRRARARVFQTRDGDSPSLALVFSFQIPLVCSTRPVRAAPLNRSRRRKFTCHESHEATRQDGLRLACLRTGSWNVGL